LVFIVVIMATRNGKNTPRQLDPTQLERALETVSIRLRDNGARPQEIVVCGGSALILSGVVARTTRDVDIVALASSRGLLSPDPLPKELQRAAAEAAEDLGLDDGWLNNDPSRGKGGLFQMGLPEGLQDRWHTRCYGSHLTVHLIGRLDQIHFKLYAAVDRGGYHVEDLLALQPTSGELVAAARWATSHDVSEEFVSIAKETLRSIGHAEAADRL
jgi:hypothetical protein